MPSDDPSPSFDQQVNLETRDTGEWIALPPDGGRSLHIYELAPADWLVSEVGDDSEGRGSDVKSALAALAAGRLAPSWWQAVVEAIDTIRQAEAHPAPVLLKREAES
jgi:hypothetical protein